MSLGLGVIVTCAVLGASGAFVQTMWHVHGICFGSEIPDGLGCV